MPLLRAHHRHARWPSCAGAWVGRFSAEELVELYGRGTSWCLQVAMDVAPEDPWAWDAGVVVDAAFARYLREAADYAGGRPAAPRAGLVNVLVV